MKATDHSAITRPRNWGSLRSWSVLALVDMNAVDAAPTPRRSPSSTGSDGASAAPAIAAPKTRHRTDRVRSPTVRRLLTSRPPATAPVPIAAVMKP